VDNYIAADPAGLRAMTGASMAALNASIQPG
jgi:hypothetical protein